MAGKLGCGGKKGRSGRKKSPTTVLNQALEQLDADIPLIFENLKNQAMRSIIVDCPSCGHSFSIPGKGDRESGTYLVDRRLGKPSVKVEAEVEAGDRLSKIEMIKKLNELKAEGWQIIPPPFVLPEGEA